MKLVGWLRVVPLVALACGLVACAGAPAKPAKPAVGTTQLTAAELDGADVAPQVGKAQHGGASERAPVKGDRKRDDRRPGGGFSGYK